MFAGNGGVSPRLGASSPRKAAGLGQHIITASGRPWLRSGAHRSDECHNWPGPRRRFHPSWRGMSPSRRLRLVLNLCNLPLTVAGWVTAWSISVGTAEVSPLRLNSAVMVMHCIPARTSMVESSVRWLAWLQPGYLDPPWGGIECHILTLTRRRLDLGPKSGTGHSPPVLSGATS